MATQREDGAQAGGSPHGAVTLSPQARRLVEGPVLATLTRLLVAGSLGVLGWGIESLFALMACGLVLYGMVMVAEIRRELWPYAGGR